MPRKKVSPVTPPQHISPNPFRLLVLAALGFIAFALIIFAFIRELNRESAAQPVVQAVSELRGDQHFLAWYEQHRAREPFLALEEFHLASTKAVTVSNTFTPSQDPGSRAIASPDNSRQVDFLGGAGEPDSRIDLYGDAPDGQAQTLAFCGTPCAYDRVHWQSNGVFVVLGSEEAYDANGASPCIGEGADRKCYRRLTATIYDLIAKEVRSYVSDPHLFDPEMFAKEKESRAYANASVELRAMKGLYKPEELVRIIGTLSNSPDGMSEVELTRPGAEPLRVNIARANGATYRYMVPGATFEVTGLMDEANTLFATSLALLSVGPAYMDLPPSEEGPIFIDTPFDVIVDLTADIKRFTLVFSAENPDFTVKKTFTVKGTPKDGRIRMTASMSLAKGMTSGAFAGLELLLDGKRQQYLPVIVSLQE